MKLSQGRFHFGLRNADWSSKVSVPVAVPRRMVVQQDHVADSTSLRRLVERRHGSPPEAMAADRIGT